MFKKFGSFLAMVGVLSFMTATVAPRRADAIVGIAVLAPVTIVVGAVIIGAGAACTIYAVKNGTVEAIQGLIFGPPLLLAGIIILPADLSDQYRFPEVEAAPKGVSNAELAEYLRDRAVLEVLAQDVRAEVGRDIVSESEWKAMSESEQNNWAEGRRREATKLWGEYVSEGLISGSSLKVLAVLMSQE